MEDIIKKLQLIRNSKFDYKSLLILDKVINDLTDQLTTKEQPTDDDEFYIDCSALTLPEQAQLRMLFSKGKIKITPIHKQSSVGWEEIKNLIRIKYKDPLNNYPVLVEFMDNIVELIKQQMKGMK